MLQVVEEEWTPCLQTPVGHSNPVLAVAFSPDGSRLASGSDDETVRFWDTSTGAALQRLQGHSDSVQVEVETAMLSSGHGSIILSYSVDASGVCVTWNNSKVLCLPVDGQAVAHAFQDSRLAIGHRSGQLTILEFNSDPS